MFLNIKETGMDFKQVLSQRIGMNEIHEIVSLARGKDKLKQELYELIFDENDMIAYQVCWVFLHFNTKEIQWLSAKQDKLIDEVLVCKHAGKRRLLLNLIHRLSLYNIERTDLLDFCMKCMTSKDELPGVQSLCMKIAYEICLPIPELLQEFKLLLDIMEPDLLPISIRTVRKNVLKAMAEGKSL